MNIKKVLELACDEAKSLSHSVVGTEHVVLSILKRYNYIAYLNFKYKMIKFSRKSVSNNENIEYSALLNYILSKNIKTEYELFLNIVKINNTMAHRIIEG